MIKRQYVLKISVAVILALIFIVPESSIIANMMPTDKEQKLETEQMEFNSFGGESFQTDNNENFEYFYNKSSYQDTNNCSSCGEVNDYDNDDNIDSSGLWQIEEIVTQSERGVGSPKMIVSETGYMYLTWSGKSNIANNGNDEDIFYRFKSPYCDYWGPIEVISTESDKRSYSPDISFVYDMNGSIIGKSIVWIDASNYDGAGGDYDIFYKEKMYGGNWSDTTVISTRSNGKSINPLAFGGYVIWREVDYGGDDLGDGWGLRGANSIHTRYERIRHQEPERARNYFIGINKVGENAIIWSQKYDYPEEGEQLLVFYHGIFSGHISAVIDPRTSNVEVENPKYATDDAYAFYFIGTIDSRLKFIKRYKKPIGDIEIYDLGLFPVEKDYSVTSFYEGIHVSSGNIYIAASINGDIRFLKGIRDENAELEYNWSSEEETINKFDGDYIDVCINKRAGNKIHAVYVYSLQGWNDDSCPYGPPTIIYRTREKACIPPPPREPGSGVGPYTEGEPGQPDGGAGVSSADFVESMGLSYSGPGSSGGMGPDSIGFDLQVNIASGAVTYAYQVLPNLVLRYNSLNSHEKGILGHGWTHGSNIRIYNKTRSIIDGYGRNRSTCCYGIMGNFLEIQGVKNHWFQYSDNSIMKFTDAFNDGFCYISEFKDKFGRIKYFEYDNHGFLKKITTAFGREIEFFYAGGKLMKIQHPSGESTYLNYNGDKLSMIIDPSDKNVKFFYDQFNRMTTVKTKNGLDYNCIYIDTIPQKRILTVHGGASIYKIESDNFFPNSFYEYTWPGNVTVTNYIGDTWIHDRNKFHRRTQVEDVDGNTHKVIYSLCGAGVLLNETNARGFTREYTYGIGGNSVTEFKDELGNFTYYCYTMSHLTSPSLRWIVEKEGKSYPLQVKYYDDERLSNINYLSNKVNIFYEFYDPMDGSPSDKALPNRVKNITIKYPYSIYHSSTEGFGWWSYHNRSDIFEYDTYGNLIKQISDNTKGISPTTTYEYPNPENYLHEKINVYRGPDDVLITMYEYDEMGRPLIITADPYGESLKKEFVYDYNGNVVSSKGPNGAETLFYYNQHNQQTLIIEDSGGSNQRSTQFTYDFNGRPTDIWDPIGCLTRTKYNNRGLPYIIEKYDNNNNLKSSTIYKYDELGNVKQIRREGSFVNYSYDALNRKISVIQDQKYFENPDGISLRKDIEYYNDVFNTDLIKKIIDPKGKITKAKYTVTEKIREIIKIKDLDDDSVNTGGEAVEINDLRWFYNYGTSGNLRYSQAPGFFGETFRYDYDDVNRISNITQYFESMGIEILQDLITYKEYDGCNNLVKETLPNGNVIQYEYDSLNRLKKISDAYGLIEKMDYKYEGEYYIVTVTDAMDHTSQVTYDSLYRVVEKSDPENGHSVYNYNNNDQLICHIDKNGISTKYKYDYLGRVIEVIENSNSLHSKKTTYTYNHLDQVKTIADDYGSKTFYKYDDIGRLLWITYPDSGVVRFEYDRAGNVLSRINQNGIETTYEYDDLHQLTKVNYPSHSNEYIHACGKLRIAKNPYCQWTFAYIAPNTKGYQLQSVNGFDYETFYDYDVDTESKVSITYPGGRIVEYTYDLRGRPIGVTSNGQELQTNSFNNVNDVINTVIGNGVYSTFEYDDNRRIVKLEHALGQYGLCLYGDIYGYDSLGNNIYTRKADSIITDSSSSKLYEMNDLNQLVSIQRGILSNDGSEIIQYTTDPFLLQYKNWNLDSNGNWLDILYQKYGQEGSTHQSRTVNDVNEYTSVGGVPYFYDNKGNLLDDYNYEYEYDVENNLIKVSDKNFGIMSSFEYGPLEHRVVSRSYDDFDKIHLFDGVNEIEERYLSDGMLCREFIPGIAMINH